MLLYFILCLPFAFIEAGFGTNIDTRSCRSWIGPAGTPLPFSTDTAVCDFLKTASVREIRRISTGVTKPEKLLLERDGVRAHAIFHYRHSEGREGKLQGEYVRHIRDSYLNQVAAYRIGRLLGLTNVPPTVLREVNDREGSLQLWIEDAMTEKDRRQAGFRPDSIRTLNLLAHDMRVFDYLINNIDRNQGNILYGPDWQLWLIDHTRAFGRDHGLLNRSQLRRCSRRLWEKLQATDDRTISQTIARYMGTRELQAVLKRRNMILKRLRREMERKGEEKVIFQYGNP